MFFRSVIIYDYTRIYLEGELARVKHPVVRLAFGAHLRTLREARGWSQQELADRADISKPTVYRIETARFSATLDVLAALAQAMDIQLRDLVDFPSREVLLA
ncbi:helix-turn-helix domain-containing protein [Hymenobacter guriensis]|uniref:helix-turn-helix domain-containing protein n=1 Tax=Hymenobacter guriensis TaxID=2793065 RepID=UPI0018CAF3FE|nr:helix-turn-helix transcriptional regulator [Hymenobacter guriensis]